MSTAAIKLIPLSSLSTVFADEKPKAAEKCKSITMLKNEAVSFQLAFLTEGTGDFSRKLKLTVESEIADKITAYEVGNVGVTRVGYGFSDDWFLRKTPGLYPDYLRTLPKDGIIYTAGSIWQALFFTVNGDLSEMPSGSCKIKVTLSQCDGDKVSASETFTLKVIDAALPKQTLTVTNWIHYDCMSHFAACKPFSARFWRVFKEYITLAARNGQNMILTPCFTPPLDTAVGKERPTVQLIGVEKTESGYSFDFSLLEKFIETALSCGVERFEHSHMFTQWGAKAAPKIVVRENGRARKMFGWHTDAQGEEYREFVTLYMTELKKYLVNKGWLDRFFFHVSDEPSPENFESYSKASSLMHSLLGDLPSGDALSKYRFYEDGVVKTPIAKSRNIYDFIGRCDSLWLYFTGEESKDYLANRIIGMPAERNRILGLQLWYYDVKGFLQWAFNAHHTVLCGEFINPYKSTDNNKGFVGGTSYLVYPETDGATPSVRLIYFRDLMQDVRACTLLEALSGRDFVKSVIDEVIPDFGIKCKVTREQMLRVRERINEEIEKHSKR